MRGQLTLLTGRLSHTYIWIFSLDMGISVDLQLLGRPSNIPTFVLTCVLPAAAGTCAHSARPAGCARVHQARARTLLDVHARVERSNHSVLRLGSTLSPVLRPLATTQRAPNLRSTQQARQKSCASVTATMSPSCVTRERLNTNRRSRKSHGYNERSCGNLLYIFHRVEGFITTV